MKTATCRRCGQSFPWHSQTKGYYCSKRCYNNVGVPVEERFWSKVLKGDGCWEWQGARSSNGYGKFAYPDRRDITYAHRVAWLLACGPIPEDMWVLHNCPGGDNRACCNPAHLWLGTNKDNDADRDEKGRHRYIAHYGEQNACSKLTEAQVREIRARAQYQKRSGPGSTGNLAREFGINPSNIRRIVRGDAWRHIA